MSRLLIKHVICPKCDTKIEASVYESVNVSVDPTLRDDLFLRLLNLAECGKCGTKVTVATNLLYHDPIKKFMVWLQLNERLEQGKKDFPELASISQAAFSSYNLRLVDGWIELVERIRSLDSALNEIAVEGMKAKIWDQSGLTQGRKYSGQGVGFEGIMRGPKSDKVFTFSMMRGATPQYFSLPVSEYEMYNAEMPAEKYLPPKGVWETVNWAYLTGSG